MQDKNQLIVQIIIRLLMNSEKIQNRSKQFIVENVTKRESRNLVKIFSNKI